MTPFLINRRTMFAPMRPSPVIPSCIADFVPITEFSSCSGQFTFDHQALAAF